VGESDNAPGRFNVFDYKGATVIADYGHNPDAIQALVKAVEAMPAKRRSVVISGRRRPPRRGHPRPDPHPRQAPSTTCCCTKTSASAAASDGEVVACCAKA
jgi:folylpolyglutamate synthase/dihydropteroate synthase